MLILFTLLRIFRVYTLSLYDFPITMQEGSLSPCLI